MGRCQRGGAIRLSGGILLVGSVAGCAGAGMTGRALVELDESWAARAAAGDVDAVMEYWTDDATMYLPDAPLLHGKAAVRGYYESRRGEPRGWMPCCAGIDEGGSMAYTLGQGAVTAVGESGPGQEDSGRYVAIWRREDGRWRCAVKCWTPSP